MLMPVTQAMIEAALSKIREADYDVPYAVVSVALEAADHARWQPIETAEKDTFYWIQGKNHGAACVGLLKAGTWVKLSDGRKVPFTPMYYQPLPSPPVTK